MSLASRVSAFFLAALAVVLVGFAASLYVLAADHLHRQIGERLDAALTTLAAAVETERGRLQWEPGQRDLEVGREAGTDQIHWLVRDQDGRLVDQSANLDPHRLPIVLPPRFTGGRLRDRQGRRWWTRVRRVQPPGPVPAEDPKGGPRPHSHRARPPSGHAALTLVAFAPLGPTEATLERLALTLTLLSTALWLVAAVAGRRLCRRALVPLTRMAVAAREADAVVSGTRLPLPTTRDELNDLGQAFNGLLDRLHEALERQRRFTGDASHQLRTPLAGLLSQVDVALRQERTPEEYQRVLTVVRAKAAHLRQIIESLLFLARAESESGQPDLELVDLACWLPDYLRGSSSHPRGDDLHSPVDPQGPLQVRVHPPLLAQLVDNLLENAGKYSRPGTPITIRLERAPGGILLAVEDRGCGLSAEDQARIFQPFYRSAEARSRGQAGVGLGLAVAHRIVTAFSGTIRVDSQPGIGSRFAITLPEAAAGADHPARETEKAATT